MTFALFACRFSARFYFFLFLRLSDDFSEFDVTSCAILCETSCAILCDRMWQVVEYCFSKDIELSTRPRRCIDMCTYREPSHASTQSIQTAVFLSYSTKFKGVLVFIT